MPNPGNFNIDGVKPSAKTFLCKGDEFTVRSVRRVWKPNNSRPTEPRLYFHVLRVLLIAALKDPCLLHGEVQKPLI